MFLTVLLRFSKNKSLNNITTNNNTTNKTNMIMIDQYICYSTSKAKEKPAANDLQKYQ